MLTKAALRRPVTTLMLFLSLMVVGAISSRMLPLEFFPEVDFPGMFVQLPYPGSTPEEVEEQIIRPAEEALATIRGVKTMNAQADENGGGIFMQFDWGTDTQIAALEAREKLDGVRHLFPSDFERFFVRKFTTGDQPILILRVSSERDLSNAYELLDRTVRSRLERVEGVAQVELYGVQPRSIRIEIDADRVEAAGVDLRQLTASLQQANFSLTAGTLSDGGSRYLVRPIGEISTPEAVAALPTGVPGIRLRDIADVRFEQPEQFEGRHLDRTYAVGMNVQKEAGANTVAVSDAVLAELALLRDDPNLRGVSIYPMENVAEGIRSSLSELLSSGMYGALFAVLILFVFLRRLSTTLIVALAVPVSILITLGALQALGLTLNIFSMMGLMLAIGMLVDNAVVVVENIHQRQSETPGDLAGAAERGTKEVGLVIVAGTLTNAIVFLPFILSPADDVTTFLKHVSIPICIAIGVSLVLSLTVVPMLTARMKPPKPHGETWIDALSARYERFLGWTLRHRGWSGVGVVLLLASVAVPITLIAFEFFPDDDENGRQLRLIYNINDSYTLERVEDTVDLVEDYLYAKKDSFEIASVYSFYTPSHAMSTLILTDEDQAQLSVDEIRERIREGLPQIAIGSLGFDWQGGDGGSSFRVSLAGESSERLEVIAADLAGVLGRIDGLDDIRTEAQAGAREVHVVVDRERARRYGFAAQDVAQTVAAAMRGQNLRRFRTPEGEVDVRLAFRAEDQRSLDDLRRLTMRTPTGQSVQLDALARFETRRAAQRISRENRVTTTTLRANLDGITSEEARERAQPILDRYRLPTGYSWSFGQQFRREQESQNLLGINLLIALALIYLVMAALFESLIYPAAIWSSILFAIVGVFWFLFLTGTTFGIMAIIGIFVLIGVVVNNGIVLLDHVGQLRARGLAREDALLRAGRERLRPILMTALTTVLSMVPLCVGTTQIGGGGPPYFPMARAIVGGLVFSTVVTLVVLPTIYLWMDNLSLWGHRMKRIGSGDEPIRGWKHAPTTGDGSALIVPKASVTME